MAQKLQCKISTIGTATEDLGGILTKADMVHGQQLSSETQSAIRSFGQHRLAMGQSYMTPVNVLSGINSSLGYQGPMHSKQRITGKQPRESQTAKIRSLYLNQLSQELGDEDVYRRDDKESAHMHQPPKALDTLSSHRGAGPYRAHDMQSLNDRYGCHSDDKSSDENSDRALHEHLLPRTNVQGDTLIDESLFTQKTTNSGGLSQSDLQHDRSAATQRQTQRPWATLNRDEIGKFGILSQPGQTSLSQSQANLDTTAFADVIPKTWS